MSEGVGQSGGLDSNNESKLGFVKPMAEKDVPSQVQTDDVGTVPLDAPQTIRESKHALVYYDWCRANWSILVMEQQAKEQFGEAISNETFRKFKNILKLRGEVLANYKSSLLNGIESSHLNVIQEMRNVIALHFKRIADIYEKEKTMQKSMGNVPYISGALQEEQSALSRDLAVLFQMEQKEKERKVKMGVYEEQEIIDIEPSKDLSETDVKREIQKLTKEQADKLRLAIFYLDGMDYLDTLLGFDVLATEEYIEVYIAHLMVVDDFSKVTEYTEMRWSEFPLFRARDVKVEEYVRMIRE
jgi:DNA-binding transcriptional ArsR family regulator